MLEPGKGTDAPNIPLPSNMASFHSASAPAVPTLNTPPMLRPAMQGGRAGVSGGPRRPVLTIPPVGSSPPVNQPMLSLPPLQLPTSTASQHVPRDHLPRLITQDSFPNNRAANTASPDPQFMRSRDPLDSGALHQQRSNTGGIGMDSDGFMAGLEHFDKSTVELARTLDVEDLDDNGWKIASKENRIEELRSLGEGAGGAVTLCKLKGGKTVFALKAITTNPDPVVKKQIVRELGFNKASSSPHICRYFGAFVDPGSATYYIAMEYCKGGSLDSIYKEIKRLGGRTGERVLGKVAEGVLEGLTYLVSKQIMHRDIKPSNILLSESGDVKLCDFGVSGDYGTKCEVNTFIGTSYYMAPERITGQNYTITADVWSTGVTLLEVAQQRFPFPADGAEMQPRAGPIELLNYIVNQPIPRLKDEPEEDIYWSDNFKHFISHCLERDPARRATPWVMLGHPWIKETKSKPVNMRRFLSTVWRWDEPERK